jgi:hypothetical protein
VTALITSQGTEASMCIWHGASRAEIAQSVQRLATDWTTEESEFESR